MFAAIRQRLRNWMFRPQISSGTITLNQRRIFILPTRQGLGFGFVLLLMMLGNINYNLSLGYVLTFLLATSGAMTMVYAFRNMAQLEVRASHIDAVFSGDSACFVFHFHNNSKLPRYQLTLQANAAYKTLFDLPAQSSTKVQLFIPATHRGWQSSGRLTLYNEFPLGLFHAWSYLQFDTRCLVYPKPSAPVQLPASSAQDGAGKLQNQGDEDFAGLRGYVAGDALQRIAWKAYAREQGLQIKQFNATQGRELWLDWHQLPHIDTERKLELLTRWILDADARQLRYGLRLPNSVLPPGNNKAQKEACLKALALFGYSEDATTLQATGEQP